MPTQKKYFSVAKEEIDSVVKESLMEKEYEEEDLEGDETGLEVGPEMVMMKNLV
jgi:hypothetical protein